MQKYIIEMLLFSQNQVNWKENIAIRQIIPFIL